MPFDFDAPIDRRGSLSMKWDVADGELPMWVADMDFAAAPPIRAAIQARAAHGVFGYTIIPEAWAAAYQGWWQQRHGFTIQTDWLIFCTGVVPAISSLVRKLTTPAEKVLIQTPVYNIFFNSILNNGRQVLQSPLAYDAATHSYAIDWQRLETDLADPQTSLMILCNPHNPVGRLWDAPTLARIGALCAKYHVTVISDEIHCDLTDPGCDYVPFAAASETCAAISVTCMAPTKAFNLAGLQTAAVCVPDPALRHRVWRALNTDEVAEPNAFAVTAAIAAFTEGGPWLDALRGYIAEGKRMTADFLQAQLPQLALVPSEATYLLWLDAGAVCDDAEALADHIRSAAGLYLSAGGQYGEGGRTFLRLNIACPHAVLQDGLRRLKAGVDSFLARG